MTRAMFGVETEYAITGLDGDCAIDRNELVGRLVRIAGQRLPHLRDRATTSGMFLQNGARFYTDCGLHPEMTTPECTTPWEAVRYIKAGERILENLLEELQAGIASGCEVMCFRCNVDYSGSGATWGCHESYLHRADARLLPDQIIPHLVSRLVYCGAGGFNPLGRNLEFMVAPRMRHIEQAISADSTGNRGIFHTRFEPLAGGDYKRLHILCGESLCSEAAILLKIGTTALVVAMADAGFNPGGEVKLAAPLQALHAVAADPACKKKLRLARGAQMTAIQIQRHYLEQAERHAGGDALPPWAGEICSLWRSMLNRLEGAPDSVSDTLDWAIKFRLYSERAARRGLPQELVPFWNGIVTQLRAAVDASRVRGQPVTVAQVTGPDTPIPETLRLLTPTVQAKGLCWEDLNRFVVVRDELLHADTCFGRLGRKGIFSQLDHCGVLRHHVPGVERIEEAMRIPPSAGRAKVRGETVSRLFSSRTPAICDWQQIVLADGRVINLSDPFCEASEPVPPAPPGPPARMPEDPFDPEAQSLRRWLTGITRRRHGGPGTGAQSPAQTTPDSNRQP